MKQQERIQKYIKGDLSIPEKAAFEKEMKADPSLMQDVEFQRDMSQFFKKRNPELEKHLTGLGEEFFNENPTDWRRYVFFLVIMLMLCGVGYYFFKNAPGTLPAEENNNTEQPTEDIPNNKELEELNIEPNTSTINESTSNPKTKEQDKNNASEKTKNKKPERLIAALNPEDFLENSLIESLIQEQVRNNDLVTDILSPMLGEEFSFDENILFELKGSSNAKPPYMLKIYSNKMEDFQKGNHLLETEIKGILEDANYQFSWQAKIPFEKGLYYLMLQQKETEELLKVSKFLVK